jgi:hypothetical protein
MDNTDLIRLEGGSFTCSECENTVKPQVSTENGLADANILEITEQLRQFPNKVIYGVCPVCGMEYMFRMFNDALCLEISDEQK